jgi:Lower baseplate protein N-terminal domain
MANTLRIKRRASGSPGAPATLKNAELAYNEVDDILYYGKGTGGEGGSATTVEAIAGAGSVVTLSGTQTITGAKTFSGAVNVPTPSASGHAATKAYVDSAVPNIEAGSGISITGTTTKTIAADSTIARLANPTFTGTPAAPTATAGTNTTQIATTAFVSAAVSAIVDTAPEALNTLNELAAALGDDANFATTVSTSLGEKLVKASNLSDLTSASTARTNLGLGSLATQASNNVSITGGSIDGITLDGGTF